MDATAAVSAPAPGVPVDTQAALLHAILQLANRGATDASVIADALKEATRASCAAADNSTAAQVAAEERRRFPYKADQQLCDSWVDTVAKMLTKDELRAKFCVAAKDGRLTAEISVFLDFALYRADEDRHVAAAILLAEDLTPADKLANLNWYALRDASAGTANSMGPQLATMRYPLFPIA